MSKPDHPCPDCGHKYASVCGCDMKLPAGMFCGVCVHWKRCQGFGFSLNYYAESCDFAPSRFMAAEPDSSRTVAGHTGGDVR